MLCFQGGNREHLKRTLVIPTLPLSITLNQLPYLQPGSKSSRFSLQGSRRVENAGTDCVFFTATQQHRDSL